MTNERINELLKEILEIEGKLEEITKEIYRYSSRAPEKKRAMGNLEALSRNLIQLGQNLNGLRAEERVKV